MENNNNENQYWTADNNSNTPAQPFTDYKQPQETYQSVTQPEQDEVIYVPNSNEPPKKKKKKKAKTIVKICAVVVLVVGVSFGSIAGYKALENNGYDVPFSSNNTKTSHKSNILNKELSSDKKTPSLLELASGKDALAITEIVKKVSPSVVGVSCKLLQGTATGTGIIMSSDGYIITNNHVVEGASTIKVALPVKDKANEYEEVAAQLIGSDKQSDLAVLKVSKTGLTAAEFGKSSELMVGEVAIAIGNPLGFDFASSVTGGIISGLNRKVTIESRNMTLIQTDAAINEGNSGGPLVNAAGQVIGINSAKISQQYAEGLGFAIPIEDAKPIIDDLISYGYVKGRPMLGITGQEVSESQASMSNVPQGIYIYSVQQGSGCEKAGLKPGDIIIGAGSTDIKTFADLNDVKKNMKAGDTLKLNIFRDGKKFEADVVLTEDIPEGIKKN